MGMSYLELSALGRARKEMKLGPLATFQHLVHEWQHLEPREVRDKVQRFYHKWASNRHKVSSLVFLSWDSC